jgi:hypothetical protein
VHPLAEDWLFDMRTDWIEPAVAPENWRQLRRRVPLNLSGPIEIMTWMTSCLHLAVRARRNVLDGIRKANLSVAAGKVTHPHARESRATLMPSKV